MAKFGEGDQRWIVKERADGANVNNWHWTTKNVTSHVTEQLNEGVKGDIFPPDSLMANCRIKSAETSGEASVNNRKGRTFIIYELEMKLKWEGELRDAEGTVLEKGSGSYRLPDVSAESLDDLEIGEQSRVALSEAMRTHGARCVRSSVQNTIKRLQAEVTAEAAAAKPPPASLPANSANNVPPPPRPIPQPIKVDPVAGPAPKPQPVTSSAATSGSSSKKAVDITDDYDDEDAPPPALAAALKKLKEDPAGTKVLRLSNLSIEDVHLKAITEVLQSSQVSIEELDLSFNRLTDAGIHVLLKAFASGMQLDCPSSSSAATG